MSHMIEHVSAIASDKSKRQPLPQPIARLFAAAEISVSGMNPISIHEVDRALKDLPVSERLLIKCTLRERGYIA